jgi:hypothetical protein
MRADKRNVCHFCYATRHRYAMPMTKRAMARRMDAWQRATWVPSMVFALRQSKRRCFRWFDSGDIQNYAHLLKILSIVEQTPDVRHYLPTKEAGELRWAFHVERRDIPSNLVIRICSPKIQPGWVMDGVLVWAAYRPAIKKASVWRAEKVAKRRGKMLGRAFVCPAKNTNNHCGRCRACWSPNLEEVIYELH